MNLIIELSNLYDINPNKIYSKINATIAVLIENTRDEKIKVKIIYAKLTSENKNGENEIIYGKASFLTIPAKNNKNLSITFEKIPIKYELLSSPLRLSPIIKRYVIEVKYKAETTILYIIPWSQEDIYKKTITLKDKE